MVKEVRMLETHDRDERRRATRTCLRGHVLFEGRAPAREVAPGALIDLSTTGLRARLSGRRPRYLAGDRVALSVRLAGGDGRWRVCRGRVVRLDAGEIAVALDRAPVSEPASVKTPAVCEARP